MISSPVQSVFSCNMSQRYLEVSNTHSSRIPIMTLSWKCTWARLANWANPQLLTSNKIILTHPAEWLGSPMTATSSSKEAAPALRGCQLFLGGIELCCRQFLSTWLVWDDALLNLLVISPYGSKLPISMETQSLKMQLKWYWYIRISTIKYKYWCSINGLSYNFLATRFMINLATS